ncbi:MAG: FliM/FliN family flagellar motor switch protein, partial [Hylemonella sp.]
GTGDRRVVPMAVDCMCGGGGRLPIKELNRRYTPIELGVRKRCVDSLASAYESTWHKSYPLRLQPLRQEQQLTSLRLVAAEDSVLHACFELRINELPFHVHLCLPRRAVDALTQAPPAADAPPEEAVRHAWGSNLQHNVYSAPVEAVAVLAKTEMTVAQLLSLSIGQVVPIDLSEPVDLMVDGVSVMQGRYGVRSGHYAMKVETIQDSHLPASAPQEEPEPPQTLKRNAQVLEQVASAMSDFTSQVQQNEGAA